MLTFLWEFLYDIKILKFPLVFDMSLESSPGSLCYVSSVFQIKILP